MIVYGAWAVLGVLTFFALTHLRSPWWLYALVIGWGLIGGLWSYLSGAENPDPRRRRP
jgi:hypothetical protein